MVGRRPSLAACLAVLSILAGGCIDQGRHVISEEEWQLTEEGSEVYVEATEAIKAGKPMSEAEMLRRLGPPDIRVTIAELAARSRTDADIEKFVDYVYGNLRDRTVTNPNRDAIPPWPQDADYLESTLVVYDGTLRFGGWWHGGPPPDGFGTWGCFFVIRQGHIEGARVFTEGNLTFVSPMCEWTTLLEPQDFVTPPKYPHFRTAPP